MCSSVREGEGAGKGGRGGGREGQGNTFIYLLLEKPFALLGFPDLGGVAVSSGKSANHVQTEGSGSGLML